jgi:hypothetical protein
MYFPAKTLKQGECDFNILRFINQRFFGSTKLEFPANQKYTLEQLQDIAWPDDDPAVDDILYRYIYSFIWGKKYFGAGFGQVSLIAGYHHLVLLHTLVKLHAKGLARLRSAPIVNMLDLAATIRQSERQVGETKLGGYAAAAWEMLLYSPKRAARLLKNS